ncbi:hypothetical protein [Actinoplanes sp. NPDC049802]|uniref:hypothetical protein n=1 Tax=Actinoplanes sp. NPDC049802 TaxID=3154742 RepID=UPI0033D1E952
MSRRVFLHVGAPKTGSTFVQNVLWDNRESLKRAGFLLPAGRKEQDDAMADLRQAPWRDPDGRCTWDQLVEPLHRWAGDVIITNEGLGGATAEQAARAVASLRPAEVHIIVVGRDLWRTLPSMWQESIRSRSLWSFEEFLRAIEEGRHDAFWNHTANRMLLRWGDLVPPERRHLITMPPPGSPELLLWERFAGVVGIPDGLCEIGEQSANPSLGAAEIELLRRVNRALGDRHPHRMPYRRVVQRHLINPVLKSSKNDLRFTIGMNRAKWISDLTEERIKELQEYPCHIVGDLGELRPADMTEGVSFDQITEKQMMDLAVETIIQLLGYADELHRQAELSRGDMLARIKKRVRRRLPIGRV